MSDKEDAVKHDESRREKLRQYKRIISRQISSQFPSKSLLPIWILTFIFVIIGLVFMLSFLAVFSFPTGLTKTETLTQPTKFIAENAYEHVRYMSVDIGVRFVGTVQNEVLAVNYLLGQINEIIRNKNSDIDIEVKHEIVEGSMYRERNSYRRLTLYRGLQNIVVKLSNKRVNENLNYILLNSHWDSVQGSPGAGDDVSMVAVMLELLRVFSKSPQLSHSVVFLFNGAEEIGLVATDGFIKYNEWAKKIGVLLNLEVIGGGGKDLVFQARSEHPWLMKAYSDSAPRPMATSLAQELYESGLILSDTDYTNFKSMYDKLPAMDFAHAYDCYTYHTRFDDIHNINLGSLQHTGDNMAALIKELDLRDEIDNYSNAVDDKGDNVFYDYLGLFLIFYSNVTGTILNSIIFAVLTIITAWCAYQIKKNEGLNVPKIILEYIVAFFIQILSILIGFAFVLVVAWFLDACNRSMSWYSNVWLLFGLYSVPYFAISGMIPYLYIKFREKHHIISTSYYVQMALHAHCNLLSIVLIFLTILRIKSAYMVLLSTMFYFLSTILNVIFNFINKGNKWLYLHCLAQLVPCSYYFYSLIQVLMSMVPMLSYGISTNPDIKIALIIALFTFLSSGFYAPIFVMFKHRKYLLGVLAAIFVSFIIMAFTPLGFPFKERSPQSFVAWHTKRDLFDYTGRLRHTDSGYYVRGSERHSIRTLSNDVPRLRDADTIGEDECNTYVMCGNAWWRFGYARSPQYTYFIPAEEPKLPNVLPRIELVNIVTLSPTRFQYNFVMTTTHYSNIQISPMLGAKLVDWNLSDEYKLENPEKWNERDFYFVYYNHGINDFHYKDYHFYLTVERPVEWTAPYTFDIALSAGWVEETTTKTEEFIKFTNSFPKWTSCQDWTGYYGGFQY